MRAEKLITRAERSGFEFPVPEEELSRVMNVTLTDVARVAATFKPDTVFFLNGTAEGEEEDYDDGY